MPFTLRTVQPVFVSRTRLADADGKPRVRDDELEAVFNNTLCNAIRQLASLVAAADDVFGGLNVELRAITDRAAALNDRLLRVRDVVEAHDPRVVPVPEGDLSVFAALPRERHFRPAREPTKCLFSAESRPRALQQLYAAAGRAALGAEALDQLDRLRRDGARSSALFLCTPVLGRARHQRLRSKVVDIDIETRKPASILELRKWTSTEALGDMTVHPDCTVRILGTTIDGEVVDGPSAGDDAEGRSGSCRLGESTLRHDLTGTDHLLPTTEEQVKAIADRFPPQMVRMDVTGRSFQRMTRHRRSLIYPAGAAGGGGGGGAADEARRPRPRRQRSRRRNTIAGTDQKEIEEALHGDRPSTVSTLATVDDIILSSSTMLNDNPKSSKEVSADFRKWAFNSLKRWGRSRFRAISSINSSTSTNIVSGELHAADPVDDINVYETVAGKRRGAGTIPISAGLSGPISLAVKLREGSLGQRRLKITDEPPHSSSGNWSASSESGRASVNSDSSHQPKSSTCSSILPHRRRFINTSTSSSVTSEGTLTPEDMAAVPFDDGETSSVYSCDTEGYYTSFHMDSGLKTLKEEEVGTGLSLPPTPMHSTSALSNCSSGRGSASLAQLTAESEYELFGKGSTSTTASSAGTVCTTLLADHSKSCDNSIGSNRSLSKGPAVPERKSSLAVPCLAEECPPCSTVVALIHNTNQGLSPRSSSGDSPDSGRNTSSSPIESVSCQQNDETDAFISPLPSIASEMEFSECSDFEGTDRIERIRVKTTINTSRIPSMCAITPPQSDDETNARQSVAVNYSTVQKKSERAPEPLPNHIAEDTNRNDNYSYRAIHMTDNNANNAAVDSNCNARSTTPVASASLTSIIHVDKKSGYATVHALDNARRENNNNQKVRPPSPSGGTLFINPAIEEVEQTGQPLHQQPLIKDALIPFTNMLSKFRKASNIGRKLPAESLTGNHQTKCDFNSDTQENDESGEYVTITDVRNNNKPNVLAQCTPQRSEASEPARESSADRTWETLEYVSLNELPISNSTELQPAVLSGSSNESSLERRKRQGARVTLDSEGKVVYSSDSLRRRKGAHTTFAPGQYVKDPSASPSPSPVANHRMPKAVIRPVHSQTSSTFSHDPQKKSPVKSVTSQVNNNRGMNVASHQSIPSNISNNCRNGNTLQKTASSLQSQDSMNLKNKVIIRAGISSPTKDLVRSSLQPTTRPMPPRTAPVGRGAYVHVRPSDVPSIKANPMYLQTDFDGPEESMRASQTVQRPEKKTEGISPQPSREPQPQGRQGNERISYRQNQPIYQNAFILGREKPSLSQPNSRRTESHYGQPVPNVILTPGRGMLLEGPSQAIDAPLHSSTPTKPDSATGSPLLVGNTFSPIERDVPQMKYSSGRQAFFNEEANQTVDEDSKRQTPGTPDNVKPSLVLTPKSTMTAEELYAKIHKSKKQMKIKCDPETVLSPQPSVGSQSPVNSERSVSPASINDPKMAARSRHSWSPNSSKYLDIASNFDPRSSTPSPNPRVPKEHGLTQTTSTQDFKRLLLQHGSGTTGKSKLSAVERLKQAKQMATNVITNNAPKFRFGLSNSNIATRGLNSQISSSSNQLQSVSSKLAPTKSSLLKPGPKNWRFADQKNDVRSTPIMEDQREDEHDLGSFEIQTLLSSPMPARNLGRPILNKQPSQEKSEISTGTQVGAMPNSGRVVPDSRVLQTLRSYQPSQESISSQNHTGYPKQLRFGPTQTLPASNQGSDSCKSVNDCPAALETAL